jgi:hypothetical protein
MAGLVKIGRLLSGVGITTAAVPGNALTLGADYLQLDGVYLTLGS